MLYHRNLMNALTIRTCLMWHQSLAHALSLHCKLKCYVRHSQYTPSTRQVVLVMNNVFTVKWALNF